MSLRAASVLVVVVLFVVARRWRVRDDSDRLENARIGYDKAVDMAISRDEIGWASFNAMATANSVLAALLVFPKQDSESWVIPFVSLIGLVLCGVWGLYARDSWSFREFYVMAAREIEVRHLGDAVRTVSLGGRYADGKSVELDIGKRPTTKMALQRPLLIRQGWLRRGAIYVLISMFAGLYGLMLAHSAPDQVRRVLSTFASSQSVHTAPHGDGPAMMPLP